MASSGFLPSWTGNPILSLAHPGWRLATLAALPATITEYRCRLADAGFYYQGQGGVLTCFKCQCRIEPSQWRDGETALAIHQRLYPQCEHLQRMLRLLPQSTNLSPGNESSVHSPSVPTNSAVGTPSDLRAPSNNPPSRNVAPPPPEASTLPTTCSVGNASSLPLTVVKGFHEAPAENLTPIYQSQNLPSTVLLTGVQASSDPNSNASSSVVISGSVNESVVASSAQWVTSTGADSQRTPSRNVVATSGARAVPSDSSPTPGRSEVSRSGAGSSQDRPPVFPRSHSRLCLGEAVYPAYINLQTRRQTFPDFWDEQHAPPISVLVTSGFYYAGYSDCVRCFYCGTGLKHWTATDNVWEEHVRWGPNCAFLRCLKGDHFVRTIQIRLGIEPEPAPTTTTTTTRTSTSTSTTTNSRTTDGSSAAPPISGQNQTERHQRRPNPVSGPLEPAAPPSESGPKRQGCGSVPQGGVEGGGSQSAGAIAAEELPEANQQGLDDMMAENERLHRILRCAVCHQNPVDSVFLPCGHLLTCGACASSVEMCPRCQGRILGSVRVYMA